MNVGANMAKYSDDSRRDDTILLSQAAMSRRLKTSYRLSLMEPSFHTNVRIPTEFPQATATAALRYNYNITPNSTGKFLLIMDPFKRDNNLFNDATLNGVGTSGTATVKQSAIDSTFIDMFRIVSAEIRITYTGQLQILSGFVTGAVSSNYSGTTQSVFYTFENIENSQNKETVSPLNGIRIIYVPKDPSMLDYITPASYDAGTALSINKYLMVLYGDGLPNTSCLRVDYFLNIEYMSKLNVREYIPHAFGCSGRLDYEDLSTIGLVKPLT